MKSKQKQRQIVAIIRKLKPIRNKKQQNENKASIVIPVMELDPAHGGVVKVKTFQLQRQNVRQLRELETLATRT